MKFLLQANVLKASLWQLEPKRFPPRINFSQLKAPLWMCFLFEDKKWCHDTQHNDTQHKGTQQYDTQHDYYLHDYIQHNNKWIATLSIVALNTDCCYGECHLYWVPFMYADCHKQTHYAECHHAECHYAECRGAQKALIKMTLKTRHVTLTNLIYAEHSGDIFTTLHFLCNLWMSPIS